MLGTLPRIAQEEDNEVSKPKPYSRNKHRIGERESRRKRVSTEQLS